MRRTALALLLSSLIVPGLAATPAAADITIFSPGISNGPLRILAAEWTQKTGQKVVITGGNVGRIRTAVAKDTPADIVLAPTSDFQDFAPKLAGAPVPLGRIQFGMVVKAGGRHPDISTEQKFIAVTKEAGTLAYANPAVGSLSGGLVEKMLQRPEFSGVKPLPIRGMIGDAIVRGDAEFGGGAISEELMAKDAEVVGPFPDSLGVFIDMSGAVLKTSAAPDDARAFLVWLVRPDSGTVWQKGGIVSP